MKRGAKAVLAITVGAVFVFLAVFNAPSLPPRHAPVFGVTFTPGQAWSFGLDWRTVYTAILDDLGVRRVRLAAYWNVVEPAMGHYVFDELDYQMDELAKRGGTAILAIGRKAPRWPECHDPSWLSGASKERFEYAALRMIHILVERYRNHPALGSWQVENEISFPFGVCPNYFQFDTLKREVDAVRSRDSVHSIVVTDSGEWSAWFPLGLYGDVLGSSLYREAWSDWFGHVPFLVSPGYYQLREHLLRLFGKRVIISELQAEPWGPRAIQEMSAPDAAQFMSLVKLKKNIIFSQQVGFPYVYLWGAEWWYWMKTQGDATYWEFVRTLKKQ